MFTTTHYDSIDREDLVLLVIEAQRSLVPDMPSYHELEQKEEPYKLRAIIAYDNEIPIGIIMYDTHKRTIEGILVYTKPEYRKRGVYGLMYKELVEEGKRLGMVRLLVYVDVDNEISKSAQLGVGLKQQLIGYGRSL